MSLVSVVSAKSCFELKRVAVRPFVGRDAPPPCRPAPLGAWDGVRQPASRLSRSAFLKERGVSRCWCWSSGRVVGVRGAWGRWGGRRLVVGCRTMFGLSDVAARCRGIPSLTGGSVVRFGHDSAGSSS